MSAFLSSSSSKRRQCAYAGVLLSALLVLPPVASAHAVEAPPTAEVEAPTAENTITAEDEAAEEADGSSFSLSATTLVSGNNLTIDYETNAPHQDNWIGIYTQGVTPSGNPDSLLWEYTPDASGQMTFTVNLPAGTYDIWYLAEGYYEPLTEMQQITVIADPALPLPENPGVPGNPAAPVEIDPVVTDVTTDGVILREMFNEGEVPAGWQADFTSAHDGDAAYAGWQATTRTDWSTAVDHMRDRFGRTDASFLAADAQQFGGSDFAATLTSAPIDVSMLNAVRLTFDSHYRGVAGQAGVVKASFDGADPVEVLRLDSESVTDGYDGMQMNAAQDIVVDTPARAKQVVFSWEFTGGEDARYWAIDSVVVHQVQRAAEGEPTQAWVVSDIQGHPADFAHGLEDLKQISPNADGLLMVGDIVNTGSVSEWQEIYDVMESSENIRPRQTVAGMGNHERYAAGGFDANFQRFLDFAERDKAWGEYVLEGPAGDLPVIVLGQEFSGPSDVPMSDAQVEFLEERLAHWTELDKQVMVMSHFPLGNTVSASWLPWYSNHHQHNDRLTSILGNYPNAVIFSGHTHYPAELGDWSMQRRTADGHADGFWAINTLAMHVEWDVRGENTAGATEITTGDINRGLTVDAYEDRLVVTAHDFASDQQLRQVTIANPLVPYAGELAPATERDADYAAVDAALSTVPADLSGYTEASGSALQTAVDAVDRTLTADKQADVDAMAAAITAAVAALETLPADSSGGAGGSGGTGDAGDTGGSMTDAAAASDAAAQGSGSQDAHLANPASLADTGATGFAAIAAGAVALLAAGGALLLRRRSAK